MSSKALVLAGVVISIAALALASCTTSPQPDPDDAGGSSSSDTATRRVEFTSEGVPVVGTLHLPAGFSSKQTYPTVVVTGSWFTVKEQMPDTYAERLAEQGYAALTFDFRHFGESGGEPRFYEDPAEKVIDVINAVDYLKTLPFVDSLRIAGVGVCISAGVMAQAATQEPTLRAVALVAPGLQNRALYERIWGSPSAVQTHIDQSRKAEKKFRATGVTDTVPVVSTTNPQAAVMVPDDSDYYLDPQRGAISRWVNKFAVMSWEPIINFDSVAVGKNIHTPLLMVESESAASPGAAKQFFADIPDPRKEQHWMTNGTQYDFYDQQPYVATSISAADAFFKRYLA